MWSWLFGSANQERDDKIERARQFMEPENSENIEFNVESPDYVEAVRIFQQLGDHPVVAGEKDRIIDPAFNRRYQAIRKEMEANEVDAARRHIDFMEGLFPRDLLLEDLGERLRGLGGESKHHSVRPT